MVAELRVLEAAGLLGPVFFPEYLPGYPDAGQLLEHVGEEVDRRGEPGIPSLLGGRQTLAGFGVRQLRKLVPGEATARIGGKILGHDGPGHAGSRTDLSIAEPCELVKLDYLSQCLHTDPSARHRSPLLASDDAARIGTIGQDGQHGWQDWPGTGGSSPPEPYIAFRSFPATHSGRGAESGRIMPECLAAFLRNRWQDSAGMGGRFGPEYSCGTRLRMAPWRGLAPANERRIDSRCRSSVAVVPGEPASYADGDSRGDLRMERSAKAGYADLALWPGRGMLEWWDILPLGRRP